MATRTETIVLRSRWAAPLLGALSAIAIIFLGDALHRGQSAVALHAAPWLAVVLWAAWWVYARPSIRITPSAITVVGLGTITTIPWHRIGVIDGPRPLAIEIIGGRAVRFWGSLNGMRQAGEDEAIDPYRPYRRPVNRGPRLSAVATLELYRAIVTVDAAASGELSGPPDPTSTGAASRVDLVPICVGIIVIAWLVASLLLRR